MPAQASQPSGSAGIMTKQKPTSTGKSQSKAGKTKRFKRSVVFMCAPSRPTAAVSGSRPSSCTLTRSRGPLRSRSLIEELPQELLQIVLRMKADSILVHGLHDDAGLPSRITRRTFLWSVPP